MKRSLYNLAAALLLGVMLVGCSQFGQNKPQSPEDSLRYGQATLTAVYDTLKQNNDAKTITLATATRVKAEADRAKRALDLAEPAVLAGNGNTATVQDQLRLALGILQPLLVEMQASLPKKTSVVETVVQTAAIGTLAVTFEALNALVSLLMAGLAFVDRTGVVSRIIGNRIAEGRDWTDEERAEIKAALNAAEQAAQASIDARRAEEDPPAP